MSDITNRPVPFAAPQEEPKVPNFYTPTHHELLAEDLLRELDAFRARIPYLEAHKRGDESFIKSYGNIPVPFLETTVVSVEQSPDLAAVRKLDPGDGREKLQYLAALRPVHDKLATLERDLRFTLTIQRSRLAFKALQTYQIAQGLARDRRGAAVAVYVQLMRRDLGKRGRPRKRPDAPQETPEA